MKTTDEPKVAIGAPSATGHRFVRAADRVFGVAPISDAFKNVELEPGESKFVISEQNLRIVVITITEKSDPEQIITDAVRRILNEEVAPTMELQIRSSYASIKLGFARVKFWNYSGEAIIDVDEEGNTSFYVESDTAISRAITEGWLENCGELWTNFVKKTVREDLQA